MADEGYGLQESAMKLGDYLVSTNKIGEQQMWILTTNKWKSFLSYSQGNMVKYCFNYLLIHKIQDYHTPRLILLTQGSCNWKKLQSCLKSSWANMFNALALTFILFYFIDMMFYKWVQLLESCRNFGESSVFGKSCWTDSDIIINMRN